MKYKFCNEKFVFNDATCGSLNANHAVTIVGYETLNTVSYWVFFKKQILFENHVEIHFYFTTLIVRNSWGSSWGQAGYVFIKRDVNMCQIEVNAMYTTVA